MVINNLYPISSGRIPSRSRLEYWENGDIFWVKTKELNNFVLLTTEERIKKKGMLNSSTKLYPIGSIIIAMYGATIGKTAKLGVEATTNQACAVLHNFKEGVLNDYVWFYMRTQQERLKQQSYGSAQPNINADIISNYPIPIPSLLEQERIVSKIKLYESKIAKAEAIIESYSTRKTAILNKYLM